MDYFYRHDLRVFEELYSFFAYSTAILGVQCAWSQLFMSGELRRQRDKEKQVSGYFD